MQVHKPTLAAALAALLVAIGSLTITIVDNGPDHGPGAPRATITFQVDGSGKAGVQAQSVTVPAKVQQAVSPNLETGLETEAPPGTSQQVIDQVKQTVEQTKATLPALPTAGATAGVPGCRTEFVRNQSSRHGVRPTQLWLHYTVSPNVTGWADVNSVVNLFNHTSSQASSNFVLDGEGHCAYIVPLEAKAWTQAASNPFAVSVEVINTGRESTYIAPGGLKELRVIAKTVSQRTGIPLRRGRVSNCTPAVSGIVNHNDGGICSGGHVDITPYSVDTVVRQITAGLRPSKKAAWVRHRQADHLRYVASCSTPAARKRNAATCAAIRSHARELDRLIARR